MLNFSFSNENNHPFSIAKRTINNSFDTRFIHSNNKSVKDHFLRKWKNPPQKKKKSSARVWWSTMPTISPSLAGSRFRGEIRGHRDCFICPNRVLIPFHQPRRRFDRRRATLIIPASNKTRVYSKGGRRCDGMQQRETRCCCSWLSFCSCPSNTDEQPSKVRVTQRERERETRTHERRRVYV